MAKASGHKRRPGQEERERREERQVLLEGLERTKTLLAQAYSGFNTSADPDLIESFVYEINSLQARYTYLLRQIKAMDSEPEELVCQTEENRKRANMPLTQGWKPLSVYR